MSARGRLYGIGYFFQHKGYRWPGYSWQQLHLLQAGRHPLLHFYTNCCENSLGSGKQEHALPSDNTHRFPQFINQPMEGLTDWVKQPIQPTAGWASKGWYNNCGLILILLNSNNCIIGGFDTGKTTDGGGNWSQISTRVGATPVNRSWCTPMCNKDRFGSDGGKLTRCAPVVRWWGIQLFVDSEQRSVTVIQVCEQNTRHSRCHTLINIQDIQIIFCRRADNGNTPSSSNACWPEQHRRSTGWWRCFCKNRLEQQQYHDGAQRPYRYAAVPTVRTGWSGITSWREPLAAPVDFRNLYQSIWLHNTNNIVCRWRWCRWTFLLDQACPNHVFAVETYYLGTGFPNRASPLYQALQDAITVPKWAPVYVSLHAPNLVRFERQRGRVVFRSCVATRWLPCQATNITGASFLAGATAYPVPQQEPNDQNLAGWGFSNYGVSSIWSRTNAEQADSHWW